MCYDPGHTMSDIRSFVRERSWGEGHVFVSSRRPFILDMPLSSQPQEDKVSELQETISAALDTLTHSGTPAFVLDTCSLVKAVFGQEPQRQLLEMVQAGQLALVAVPQLTEEVERVVLWGQFGEGVMDDEQKQLALDIAQGAIQIGVSKDPFLDARRALPMRLVSKGDWHVVAATWRGREAGVVAVTDDYQHLLRKDVREKMADQGVNIMSSQELWESLAKAGLGL